MKVQLKGYKTFTGHDGPGYEASIYVDGKRTALALDLATGGELEFHIFDKDRFDALSEKVISLPGYTSEHFPGHTFDMDLDVWIDQELVGPMEMAKSRKVITKTADGKYWKWDAKYTKKAREVIQQRIDASTQQKHEIVNGTPVIVELE